MKLRRIGVSVLSGALAMMMLAGCGSEESSSEKNAESTAEAESQTGSQAENSGEVMGLQTTGGIFENVKVLGRTYFEDGTLWLGHSATGVDFDFTGETVKITLTAPPYDENNQPRAALYVDGERREDKMITTEGAEFEVKGSADKAVNVKVVKLSECANSCLGITGIDAGSGTVTPAAAKSHKIEIIGDSITCGYGVDDEDKDHHFSTKTEDCTKSYSYKTAQLLDADYSLVSFSGFGIVSGYTGTGKKVEAQQLPKYYEKVGYCYSLGFGTTKPDSLDWDFSKFEPEVIVINLGTNDASYAKKKEQKEEYKTGYVNFLKQVRAKNPSAKIFCTLGTMGTTLNKSMRDAAEAYTAETGDSNIAVFDFPQQDMNEDGIAADWHPSDKTHTKSAELLSDFIKKEMGW